MRKNIKKVSVMVFLALFAGMSSCQSITTNPDLEKLVTDPVVSVPKIDRGALSGTVTFDLASNGTEPDTTVKIVREEDVLQLDSSGKVVKDSKTGKPINLETKGSIIATSKVSNGQFLISDLRPGAITVIISNKQNSFEVASSIEVGKVRELKNIAFDQLQTSDQQKVTQLVISGKVVRSDGTPVANAKVSDVTGGFVNNFSNTNNEGDFSLKTPVFKTSRNLEIISGNLTTSLAITPEQLENLTIPLIANSRLVKGKLLDFVIKTKPVADATVKVSGTSISTVTDKDGNFSLRGVPTTAVTLEMGSVRGYIDQTQLIESAQTSDDLPLGNIFVRPIGTAFVNIQADNSAGYVGSPTIFSKSSPWLSLFSPPPLAIGSYVRLTTGDPSSPGGGVTYEYDNGLRILVPLAGTIQFEGTAITKDFSYPPTPTRIVTIFSGINKETRELFNPNFLLSVPINNIPGGEYTISIALEHHQTQKGVKIVVPSNDIISTELIQMRLAQSVITYGYITGKVLIKDVNGQPVSLTEGNVIKVATIKADEDDLTLTRIAAILKTEGVVADANGTYSLSSSHTGTNIIVAGVVNVADETLVSSVLPNTYVLLNVIQGSINNAPDITLTLK